MANAPEPELAVALQKANCVRSERLAVRIRQPYGEAIKGTAELVMRVSAEPGKA